MKIQANSTGTRSIEVNEQHLETIRRFLQGMPQLCIELLTGSVKGKKRKEIMEGILDGFVFIGDGKIVMSGEADAVRKDSGKTLDELFREVFRCF